jgi:hypothetical protein
MAQATIKISFIGPVETSTSAQSVVLAGALAANGMPINCTTKAVSRNKKAAAAAAKVPSYIWPKEVPDHAGHFILIDFRENIGE